MRMRLSILDKNASNNLENASNKYIDDCCRYLKKRGVLVAYIATRKEKTVTRVFSMMLS